MQYSKVGGQIDFFEYNSVIFTTERFFNSFRMVKPDMAALEIGRWHLWNRMSNLL